MYLFILFFLLAQAYGQDPCTNYKLLDEPHRSSGFIPQPTDRLICDRGLTAGWYKFGNNQNMPTSCVPQYHCGTDAPVWMKGALPSIAEGEAPRTACINLGFAGFGANCCNQRLNIKVKNCNGFYVYYLTRVPGCSIGYCAGTKPVCDIGSYNTITKTCQELYPKMTRFPELLNPETVNNDIRFPCKVNYPTGEPGVEFDVTWNVDGQVLTDPAGNPIVNTLTGNERVAYLNSMAMQGHLGKNLHCKVTSYFKRSPLIKSDSLQSNAYWCGIKVSKTAITVDEKNPEQEITLESTLPVPCRSPLPQDCKIRVELKASNDPFDTSTDKCVYELTYDRNTQTYRGTVKIKATRDFIDDKDRNHEVSFRPLFDINQPMWMGYHVSPVQVHTIDSKSGSCQGTGDPHWIGMDKGRWNTYEVGDFVLYKSTSRDFEIQVRTWACGHYHPCICAVIAKEGNDIVKVDICERRRNQIANPEVNSLSNHPLEETTVDTDKSGKSFYLNFASGARVKIDCLVGSPRKGEKDGYLNIFIQSPSDDFEHTEGLCGTWTNNTADDFTGPDGQKHKDENSFSHSWRLQAGQSLFDQPPLYSTAKARQPHYCKCGDQGDVDCTMGKGAKNPLKGNCNGPCVNMNKKLHPRNVRSDDSILTHDKRRRDIQFAKRTISWPTASGITHDKAVTMCTAGLKQSSLFSSCGSSNPDLPFDAYVANCVEDVFFADGDNFILGHMNAFDNACQDTLIRNISNYHTNSKGELTLNPVLVATCPNNCNLQGTCVSGSCVCNHGFTSVDCSVQIGVPPTVDHITGDGLCDIRQSACAHASVIAENLMSSNHLQCRYRKMHTVGSKLVPYGSYILTNAVFKTFLEVECSLPQTVVGHDKPVEGFSLSVTTDGIKWSNEQPFVIYDSRCQHCDSTGACTTKTGSCLIDGRCHRDGEQNAAQLMCKPSSSQTSWSIVPGVKEIDFYTASFTGCRCEYKPTSFTCACCQNGGCQCGQIQPNQCTHCNEKQSTCGAIPELFPPQP